MKRLGITFWNLKSNVYDSIRTLGPFKKVLDREVDNLKALLEEASLHPVKILDVGMGTGSTLEVFPDNARIIGMDYVYGMIRKSKIRKSVMASCAITSTFLRWDRWVNFLRRPFIIQTGFIRERYAAG